MILFDACSLGPPYPDYELVIQYPPRQLARRAGDLGVHITRTRYTTPIHPLVHRQPSSLQVWHLVDGDQVVGLHHPVHYPVLSCIILSVWVFSLYDSTG